MSAPARWHAPDAPDFHWAGWDEQESFLFNPASGQTHLLNALGRELVESLAAQPDSAAGIAAALYSPDYGVSEADFATHVADQIRQLHLIGLLEPAP